MERCCDAWLEAVAMSVATSIRTVFTQLMWPACWLNQLTQLRVSVLQMDNIVAAICEPYSRRMWRNDCLGTICFNPGLCDGFGHAFELYWCGILRGAGADHFRVIAPVGAKINLVAVIDPLAHFHGISSCIAGAAALAIPPVVSRFPGEAR